MLDDFAERLSVLNFGYALCSSGLSGPFVNPFLLFLIIGKVI